MTQNHLASYVQNALVWAQRHLGSKAYSGRCLAFVEDAYEQSNGVEIFGGSTAKESAEQYGATASNGEPYTGDFVFYDCSGPIGGVHQNWGHVGLYIGEGKVIHAWQEVRIDHYLAVQELSPPSGWTPPTLIGWVPVERIFQGYRKRSWG